MRSSTRGGRTRTKAKMEIHQKTLTSVHYNAVARGYKNLPSTVSASGGKCRFTECMILQIMKRKHGMSSSMAGLLKQANISALSLDVGVWLTLLFCRLAQGLSSCQQAKFFALCIVNQNSSFSLRAYM